MKYLGGVGLGLGLGLVRARTSARVTVHGLVPGRGRVRVRVELGVRAGISARVTVYGLASDTAPQGRLTLNPSPMSNLILLRILPRTVPWPTGSVLGRAVAGSRWARPAVKRREGTGEKGVETSGKGMRARRVGWG